MTWIAKIEIEFPVEPADTEIRFEGDAEPDFARHALDRIRPALEAMRAQLGPEAHYHIIVQPWRS